MSRSERVKGAEGELEVAAIFRAHGFDCDRTPNSGGLRVKGDLAGTVPAHIEVKRQERLQLPIWLRQAAAEAPAGVVPVVTFRQNRGQWYAVLPLEHLASLMGSLAVYTDAAAERVVSEFRSPELQREHEARATMLRAGVTP